MNFIQNTFLVLSLFVFSFANVYATEVSYSSPVWGDIDQESPPLKAGDSPALTDRIAYEGGQQLLTAFSFCDALGYDYVSYLNAGQSDPSVTFKDSEWNEAGNKESFLKIVCDDGEVVTSSSTPIVVDVNIPPAVDYTIYFQFFMILFSSLAFMFFLHSFSHLMRKFL